MASLPFRAFFSHSVPNAGTSWLFRDVRVQPLVSVRNSWPDTHDLDGSRINTASGIDSQAQRSYPTISETNAR